jgi:hypothetical protein
MIDVTDTPVSAHRTESSINASGKAPAEDAKPIFRGGSSFLGAFFRTLLLLKGFA